MDYLLTNLFFQAPCDNGSKIQNYILQWDEVMLYAPPLFDTKLVEVHAELHLAVTYDTASSSGLQSGTLKQT